jgi:hypothetical protein
MRRAFLNLSQCRLFGLEMSGMRKVKQSGSQEAEINRVSGASIFPAGLMEYNARSRIS